MSETSKSGDIARFAAFTAAMSVATDRVNDFSARLAALTDVSRTAALQIAKLSSSAARMMAICQVFTTCCQCTRAAPTGQSSRPSSYLETAQRWIVQDATLLAAAGVLFGVGKWLLTTSAGLRVMSRLGAIRGAVTAIWEAVAASEAVAAVAEAAGALTALVVHALEAFTIVDIVGLAAAVAAAAGLVYLAWRNRNAIVRAIRRAASAVSSEVIAIMSKLASAVMGEPEGSTREDLGPDGDAAMRRPMSSRGWNRLRSLGSVAPTVLASVTSGSTGVAAFAFMALKQPGLWSGFQPGGLTLRKAAAIAMLAAPLLATPALAAIPSGQRGAGTACLPSIVINSAPTIVINSNQPADIEHRVLEALRQDREAIYEQWFREMERRQRTEL